MIPNPDRRAKKDSRLVEFRDELVPGRTPERQRGG